MEYIDGRPVIAIIHKLENGESFMVWFTDKPPESVTNRNHLADTGKMVQTYQLPFVHPSIIQETTPSEVIAKCDELDDKDYKTDFFDKVKKEGFM